MLKLKNLTHISQKNEKGGNFDHDRKKKIQPSVTFWHDFTLRNNVIIQNWPRCGYGGTLNIRYLRQCTQGKSVATYMYVLISFQRNDPFLRMVICN